MVKHHAMRGERLFRRGSVAQGRCVRGSKSSCLCPLDGSDLPPCRALLSDTFCFGDITEIHSSSAA